MAVRRDPGDVPLPPLTGLNIFIGELRSSHFDGGLFLASEPSFRAAKIVWTSLKLPECREESWASVFDSHDLHVSPAPDFQFQTDYSLDRVGLATLSVSRSWNRGRAQKRVNEVDSGRPLRQKIFTYVMGAKSQPNVLGKQVSLLERAGIGAVAGGIAGGFTNATLHPIDTVKTKLQTQGAAQLYSGPLDVVVKVLATQGIAGFYRGVHAALLGSAMSSSVYFGTYESAKGVLCTLSNCPQTLIPPLAAALGNITSSAFLVPKEVIKQRMQAGAIGSAKEVFLKTVSTEGVGGLYVGYSAALLRNLPTNIISFSTFEYLKLAWLNASKKSYLEPWQSVVSGALAGALSAAATTPLDVVKTRLMTQARHTVSSTGVSGMKAEAAARAQVIAAYTYSGVSETLRQIWMEEGSKGLMQGVVPRVFYSACFSAIGFFAFESTRALLLMQHSEWRRKQNTLDMKPMFGSFNGESRT